MRTTDAAVLNSRTAIGSSRIDTSAISLAGGQRHRSSIRAQYWVNPFDLFVKEISQVSSRRVLRVEETSFVRTRRDSSGSGFLYLKRYPIPETSLHHLIFPAHVEESRFRGSTVPLPPFSPSLFPNPVGEAGSRTQSFGSATLSSRRGIDFAGTYANHGYARRHAARRDATRRAS